jgi:cbb3-type cytochrome oxidase maturation protein
MDITYLIILGAVYLGLVGLIFLIWAIRSGQFEDMEGPKYRILFDDED